MTEEELRQFDGPDDRAHEAFFNSRAQELAKFLADFAVKKNLPKACAGRAAGGIAVMGWSAGNAYTLCLLSHASAVKDETREQLEPFLRSVIIFDTPGYVIGRPSVLGGKFILLDTSLTLEERSKMFGHWVSSYFNHPNVASHKLEDLQFIPDTNEQTEATAARLSETEYRTLISPEAAMKVDVPATLYPLEEFAQWTKRALFDDGLAQKYWPRVKVDAIWCERTCWTCVDGGWGLEELRKKYDLLGVKGRPMKVTMMSGANHFPHWDEPERTIALFAATLNER